MPSITLEIPALVAFSISFIASPAFSQSTNTLSILQNGNNNGAVVNQQGSNKLSIEQAGSWSTVGGVDVSRSTITYEVEVERNALLDEGDGVVARTMSTETRSIDVLRSRSSETAIQRGMGNDADIKMTGDHGTVGLLQDSGLALFGNSTTIRALLGSDAFVGQIGSGNQASLLVSNSSQGTILQQGDGNSAELKVTGRDSEGSISQIGNGNVTALDVDGSNTSISYVVQGNNLSSATGTGVQVVTNASSVQIIQQAF